VALSTRVAIASERITTDVIMVPLFPYLVVRHQVSDIPTVIVDGGAARIVGPLPEDEFVTRVIAAG
jgi:hypothetical protein